MQDATRQERRRVLVVEDDEVTRNAMRIFLEHYEFDVSLAGTVQEAIQQLHSQPHHVLLDLGLPDGDGSKVLEQIRYQNLPIRVSVITGSGDTVRCRRAEGLRPERFLRKPIDLLGLLKDLRVVA